MFARKTELHIIFHHLCLVNTKNLSKIKKYFANLSRCEWIRYSYKIVCERFACDCSKKFSHD